MEKALTKVGSIKSGAFGSQRKLKKSLKTSLKTSPLAPYSLSLSLLQDEAYSVTNSAADNFPPNISFTATAAAALAAQDPNPLPKGRPFSREKESRLIGDCGDSDAVEEGVLTELIRRGGGASDLGDGDLARVDGGINGERDKISNAIDGAAEEVEAWAKVGYGGGSEGVDGGEDRFGFGTELCVGGGERKMGNERFGFEFGGVWLRREKARLQWRLAADCDCSDTSFCSQTSW
ncbi:hypothetical protein Ancab_028216 [Ancistrocladus abbreviatus]